MHVILNFSRGFNLTQHVICSLTHIHGGVLDGILLHLGDSDLDLIGKLLSMIAYQNAHVLISLTLNANLNSQFHSQ